MAVSLLPASCLGGMLWQGEREVMWDTVQLQATHTLALTRDRRGAAEQDALSDPYILGLCRLQHRRVRHGAVPTAGCVRCT